MASHTLVNDRQTPEEGILKICSDCIVTPLYSRVIETLSEKLQSSTKSFCLQNTHSKRHLCQILGTEIHTEFRSPMIGGKRLGIARGKTTLDKSLKFRLTLEGMLQALFRPVSMCIPDLALICEIQLMAEGFQQSKTLSRKFVILYRLCEDLLSKSQHYDWKLRAIKTTLAVAGGMKRAAPELSEDKVNYSSAVITRLQAESELAQGWLRYWCPVNSLFMLLQPF